MDPAAARQDVDRVVVALPEDHGRRVARLVEVDGVGDPIPAQVRAVTDAGHDHGHVLGRLEIAEEERVVLQLGPVDQNVGAGGQKRLEQRDAVLVTLDGRAGQIHFRRGKVAGGPTGQQLLSAHGTGYAAPTAQLAHPVSTRQAQDPPGNDVALHL